MAFFSKQKFFCRLDALLPAAAVLSNEGSLVEAALAASRGAEETKTMDSAAGRSNYIPSHLLRGIADPGAIAVAQVSIQCLLKNFISVCRFSML